MIDRLARFGCQVVAGVFFRAKIVGSENVPVVGPALLVANHVTFLDGFLIAACVPRMIRFLIWKPYFEIQLLGWFFRRIRAIPVGSDTRSEVLDAIRDARSALVESHIVCIFAEGGITRTGELLPFKRGLEKIVEGLDVPIVPMHLEGLWGSFFSFKGERLAWKVGRLLRFPVTVSFGSWLTPSSTADQVRRAIQDLGQFSSSAVCQE